MATPSSYITIAKQIEDCQRQVPSIGQHGAIAAVIVAAIIDCINRKSKLFSI